MLDQSTLKKSLLKRNIPEYMHDAVERYIFDGIPPGDFLSSLLSNDLFLTYGYADDTNIRRVRDYIMLLYNDCPGSCWGSPEKFKNWCKEGGLNGISEAS